MKAKEFAAKYLADKSLLSKICFEMFDEIGKIKEIRNVKTNEGWISIMNEQIDKWRAFTSIVEKTGDRSIDSNGFKNFLIKHFPELKNRLK